MYVCLHASVCVCVCSALCQFAVECDVVAPTKAAKVMITSRATNGACATDLNTKFNTNILLPNVAILFQIEVVDTFVKYEFK